MYSHMGILEFFTQFTKKKEIEIEQINLKDIDTWFNKLSQKNKEKGKTQLEQIRKDITTEKEKTLQNLNILLETKPKNADLPAKALHYLEGNRKKYPQKVELFLKDIELPSDIQQTHEFFISFEEKLNSFGKNTVKNYSILKDLIGKEALDVATNIKHLATLVTKAKKIVETSKIQELSKIHETIINVQQKLKRKKELKNEIVLVKLKIEQIKKDIEEKEILIQNIKQSEEHTKYLAFIDTQKDINLEIQELHNTVTHSFSILETALKKYERISMNNKLINMYLKSPIQTLLNDTELKIREILSKMSGAIIDGTLELKNTKKEKSMNEIKKLDSLYLTNFIETNNTLQLKLKEIRGKIENDNIISKINTLQQKLDLEQHKYTQTKQKLESIKNEEQSTHINAEIEKIEKIIQEKLEKSVKITML
jgi:hypothetical protein